MDSTRDRFLETTEQLLREAGMAGTGIKEVVARSGAPIGSVYHHFPGGKAQLVIESLERHAGKSHRLLERFFDGKRSAPAALRTLFDAAAEGFERGGANKACAIGSVTLDLTDGDAAIRRVCRATFDDWVAVIAPQLPWRDAKSRRSFAIMVVIALEGAFILAKSHQSGDPFREAGKWLASMLPTKSKRRRR